MSGIEELQRRLIIAKECNNSNNQRRETLERTMKEQFGCSSLEELAEKEKLLKKEADELQEKFTRLLSDAERQIDEIERKVNNA